MTPPMISVSALNEVLNIRHGFFTREGGVSAGPYASLNCGLATGDDPANVAANRARALSLFDLPADALASVTQKHTADVVTIDDDWQNEGAAPVADAMVTRRAGVALGILSADCAPVLFVDPKANVIGAAHAGWRGALGGVLDNTVAAMVALGAKPTRIIAAVGPSIAQRSYEVGAEFPEPFLNQDRDNRFFFAPGRREGHHFFDLPGYVARCLARIGLTVVARTPCDTCREEDRFFSFRRSTLRGEAECGRTLSVIVLER